MSDEKVAKVGHRTLTVTEKRYRKRSRRDGRRRFEYCRAEIRLTNAWLRQAGFKPGDRVVVANPRVGALVLMVQESI